MTQTITTKRELLEKLEVFNKDVTNISENALYDSKFRKWMSTTTVTEEEVNYRTWWYPQEVTVTDPYEVTIVTSVIYDAFSYNGNDEDYFTLAVLNHKLSCSREIHEYFMLLYEKSVGGTNWSRRYAIMVFNMKKELGLLPPRSYQLLKISLSNPQRLSAYTSISLDSNSSVDPDDFFDSF
ncbi:hypothetical protein [Rufibacter immobilis]|uniref:hypothetical protein n=1 Tax=Rufibacter immobilis TaxID=1348778 RepID=UPI0035ECD9DF